MKKAKYNQVRVTIKEFKDDATWRPEKSSFKISVDEGVTDITIFSNFSPEVTTALIKELIYGMCDVDEEYIENGVHVRECLVTIR